jgi:O-succinylbenzoate synthase
VIEAERWKLLRYDLPLHRPLTTGGGLRRQGLLLTVHRGTHTGYGEAAPIPGFHPDSLDVVAAQLTRTLRDGIAPTAAVARFCIESAALSLAAAEQATRPAALLTTTPAPDAPINALIDDANPGARARVLVAEGCGAVKIKVGRRGLDHEIQAIRAVSLAAPGLRIRLDANRAWTLDKACRFCDALSGVRIDYLEEPLRDPALLSDFYARTGVGIGLDESLSEGHGGFPDGTAALVIKPTVVGGIEVALGLSARAQELGAQAVISATFETSVGLGMLCEVACATRPDPPPQGLGTGRWLAGDVCEPLEVVGSRLSWRPVILNMDGLVEVSSG